jgi:hypothetical protein
MTIKLLLTTIAAILLVGINFPAAVAAPPTFEECEGRKENEGVGSCYLQVSLGQAPLTTKPAHRRPT